MESYRKTIRKRVIYLRVFMLITLVILVPIGIWGYGEAEAVGGDAADFAYGAQSGLALGMLLGLIIRSRKYAVALKNEQYLKKLHIEEKDERTRAINLQVGSVVYYISLYGIFTGAIIAGFLNEDVFITLIAVGLFMIALRGVVGIYYKQKY